MTEPGQAVTRSGPPQRWLTVVDGFRIRELRRQMGLTQVDLAAESGMSLATVTRLERQPRASCRPRTLGRLAAALDTQPASLEPGR